MDLSSRYLGLELRSPVVASASPVSLSLDGVRQCVDHGVGAVVMYSLFEEQIREQQIQDLFLSESHEDGLRESAGFFPDAPTVAFAGAQPYLSHLERVAAAVEVPVIASLNGSTQGGWTDIAASMESAGAAAIELNIYLVPGDLTLSGAAVEAQHLEILAGVKASVSIPVAVKLSPFFSSPGAMALALDEAGADGLVLFNRFLQPAIDVESVTVRPGVTLSSPTEALLPRTWIAILRGRVRGSLAATTGVETGDDVVAYLLAGADVVMTASALLRHGPAYVATLTHELEAWLDRKGYTSVAQARGVLAVREDVDAGEYERAGYVRALRDAQAVYGPLVH